MFSLIDTYLASIQLIESLLENGDLSVSETLNLADDYNNILEEIYIAESTMNPDSHLYLENGRMIWER
ncbi:MAG TPA: hypothetical protein EYN33_06465 [Gammaproteobacteria bacterium]|nr:hypothetical protein [Gammaproteobacteria bacterium]